MPRCTHRDPPHALVCLGHAAQLRDALTVADEQLLSRSASVVVEIRRGRSVVALLTWAGLGPGAAPTRRSHVHGGRQRWTDSSCVIAAAASPRARAGAGA